MNIDESFTYEICARPFREIVGESLSPGSSWPKNPAPIVPEPKLTPGEAFEVTVHDLFVPGYSKKVRDVPEETKGEDYREYGITSYGSGDYEVDQGFHSNWAALTQ